MSDNNTSVLNEPKPLIGQLNAMPMSTIVKMGAYDYPNRMSLEILYVACLEFCVFSF